MLRGYLAAPERVEELDHELAHAGSHTVQRVGRLLLAEGGPDHAVWARNVWLEPEWLPIRSVSDAAAQLRQRQRNWALLDTECHRRAKLIEGSLPHVSAKALRFGAPCPSAPLGSFTLLEPHLVLASGPCTSPFPNGELSFHEQKQGPPSRAYLKLWELFTRLGVAPTAGERCLDLGSSPGGWTYVLAQLGAEVESVDKAPLAPGVRNLRGVRFVRQSAFALDPRQHPAVDWLFSDVICYPSRLLALVQRWLDAGKAQNLVCTLKFQGDTDHETVRAFAAIPGSRLAHLSHNRHELTWWRLTPSSTGSTAPSGTWLARGV